MTNEEYSAHCRHEKKVSLVLKGMLPEEEREYDLLLSGTVFFADSASTNVFMYFGVDKADWPRLIETAEKMVKR